MRKGQPNPTDESCQVTLVINDDSSEQLANTGSPPQLAGNHNPAIISGNKQPKQDQTIKALVSE
jgi:hypothetical protein